MCSATRKLVAQIRIKKTPPNPEIFRVNLRTSVMSSLGRNTTRSKSVLSSSSLSQWPNQSGALFSVVSFPRQCESSSGGGDWVKPKSSPLSHSLSLSRRSISNFGALRRAMIFLLLAFACFCFHTPQFSSYQFRTLEGSGRITDLLWPKSPIPSR